MYKTLIATIALIALTATYVSAECNNMCSGHGICSQNDACICYRNWRGNDCSERTCQYGVAFVDTPQGDLDHDGLIKDDFTSTPPGVVTQWAPLATEGTFEQYPNFDAQEAHSYMECSNKGLCDRVSGECVCFDGYEGSACQRTVCPSSCSGHGVCRNIVDVTQALSTGSHAYQLWDGLKNQACVCDPGYAGVDCNERLCPKGHDPLDDEDSSNNVRVDEVQTINVDCGGNGGTDCDGKTFKLQYTDVFGETWTTSAIAATNVGATAGEVTNALVGIPNNVIESVTVTTAAEDGGNDGTKYTITFTHNPGDLVTLATTEVVGALTITIDGAATVGTKIASECSGRGLCDYETGICKCFRGYRLDDCSSQHALAFGSSQ